MLKTQIAWRWRQLSPWLPSWWTVMAVMLECYKLATAIFAAYGVTYLMHQLGIVEIGGGAAAGYWILGLTGVSIAAWFFAPAGRPKLPRKNRKGRA